MKEMRTMWCQTAAWCLLYIPVVQKQHSMALLPGGNENLWGKVWVCVLLYIFHSLHHWLQMHSSLAWNVEIWVFKIEYILGRNADLAVAQSGMSFQSTVESKFCFLLQSPSSQCLTQLRWKDKVKEGIFWTTYFHRAQSSWSIKSMFKETKHRGENNSQEPWVI